MEKMSGMTQVMTVNGAMLLVLEVRDSVDELFQQLSLIDLTEFSNLKSDKRRLEYLGVRLALKILLGEEKQIIYDADGKPALVDNSFQISISHSGGWVAVMADASQKVGIDIEVPTNKIEKVYKRFLNDTEQVELFDGKNLNQLMLAWSGKEALYKIIGIEAVDFANQLHIFPFEVQQEGVFEAEHVQTKTKYKLHYIQNEAYTLVYCVDEH